MSLPFLPDDFLKPRLLVPCSFGVASLSADAADEGGASGDEDEDDAFESHEDASESDEDESCTGAVRADGSGAGLVLV